MRSDEHIEKSILDDIKTIIGITMRRTKGGTNSQSNPFETAYLKDKTTGKVYKATINNGEVETVECISNTKPDEVPSALKPVITFIDDDNKTNAYTLLYHLFKEKNVKADFAVNAAFLGNNGYITLDQAKEMKNNGMGIVCHGNHHTNNKGDDCVLVYKEYSWYDKKFMENNGFWNNDGHNVFVYPGGFNGDKSNTILSNWYEFGIKASGNVNVFPMPFALGRKFLCGSAQNSLVSLETMKSWVDECYEKNGWLILGTHSWALNSDECAIIGQLIDYIKSKGIDILTSHDALAIKGYKTNNGFYDENSKWIVTYCESFEGETYTNAGEAPVQCTSISFPDITEITEATDINVIMTPSNCTKQVRYVSNLGYLSIENGIATPVNSGTDTIFAICDNLIIQKSVTVTKSETVDPEPTDPDPSDNPTDTNLDGFTISTPTWTNGGKAVTFDDASYNNYSSGFYSSWIWLNSGQTEMAINLTGVMQETDSTSNSNYVILYNSSLSIIGVIRLDRTKKLQKIELPSGVARAIVAINSIVTDTLTVDNINDYVEIYRK